MKTQIVFVLDRSGSMSGLEKDVIGGFNSYITQQKKEEGEAVVTTVLFDHQYDIIHDQIPIYKVPDLTSKEYYPRGMTALLDAVGNTISLVEEKKEKDDKVIFMINTDGYENSSKEYTYPLIQKLIKKHSDWEFVFLGAKIDAEGEADKLGIRKERAVRYYESSDGMDECYQSLSAMTTNYRNNSLAKDDDTWKENITANYNKHKK